MLFSDLKTIEKEQFRRFLTKKNKRRISNRWSPGISQTEDKIYMKTKVRKKVGKKERKQNRI